MTMPAISKIRFTNVIYEGGGKRYNDEIFQFDGHSGAIVLENGGGKTVFIQTAIQAVVPHMELADRKIKETLALENGAAHIAIEWIVNDSPRRYAVTAVTLFMENNSVNSYKYAYEYGGEDPHNIDNMPFTRESADGSIRPASKGEILDYYQRMVKGFMSSKMFDTITEYQTYIEDNYKIIPSEWRKIGVVNSAEGDVDKYFDGCKTTSQLLNKLLIPVVEEAIEGAYNNDFVKTFEKQREHFKKNKMLLKQIEESQETREQLQKYIEIFAKFHDSEEAYLSCLGEIKDLYQFVEDAYNRHVGQLAFLDEQLKMLEEKSKTHEKKKLSMRILERKLRIEQVQQQLDHALSAFLKIKQQYDEKASRKQNIEITELHQDVLTCKNQLELMEEQLSRIDQDVELADLLEELAQNSGQIKGFFTRQLEQSKRDTSALINQKERYADELSKMEKDLKQKVYDLQEDLGHKVRLKTLNGRLADEIQALAKELLEPYVGELVEEQLVLWKERLALLQNQMLKMTDQLQNEAEEKVKQLDQLKLERNNKEEALAEQNQLSMSLERIDGEQEKLSQSLEAYVPHLYFKNVLYEKQSSIENILIEKEVQQAKRKEAAFKEERLSSRLVDYYGEAEVFTADVLLLKIVEELKALTTHIELGSKYYDQMRSNIAPDTVEAFEAFPYWAITLITTDKDLETVTKRIYKYKAELTHPVLVFTLNQVRDILSKPELLAEAISPSIFPELWTKNLKKQAFEEWKAFIIEEVKEKQLGRKTEEYALAALIAVSKQVYDFFAQYPYDDYEGLKQSYARSLKATEVLNAHILQLENRIEAIDQNTHSYHQKINGYKDESNQLNQKIVGAHSYMNKQRELANNEELYAKILGAVEQKEQEKKHLEEYIKTHIAVIEDLKSKITSINWEINKIEGNALYHEVKNAQVISSDLPLKVLTDKRQLISDKIGGKNSDRVTLISRIADKKEELIKTERTLHLKEKEAEYTIEVATFTYDKESSDLIDEMKKLNKHLKDLQTAVDSERTALEVERDRKESMVKECLEKYGEVITFNEDLLTLQNHLEKERKEIKINKDTVWQNRQRETELVNKLALQIDRLKTLNYRHDFLNALAGELAKSYELENLEKIIAQSEQELERDYETYNQHKNEVEAEKNRLRRYCQNMVKDVKLRDMVISGVEHKQHYTELLEFGSKMLERINQIIRLAEHDRMTSDKELQIFLEHLHTYVVTVVSELDVIQRKTRISIDGNLKDIFIITIPTWEEQAGKEELRKHMDWIIDQLDQQKDGEADETTTSKNLENWLSVKRLLQCVMGDQTIKIKCRKVTNDKKISSLPSSWEYSNQWSGGEKWSKNMTLFLGILIYIAEKKQYLTSGEKKHRTVILDNPFGKASSKHVLDPVFFIAERLGFQIIALTAHAEGEFIRNYFPVVYSCRLRSSAETGKQIMTKEKEIHYAYLKEHDPQSLIRFQEVEQITIDQLLQ